jgi:hypothetical protein
MNYQELLKKFEKEKNSIPHNLDLYKLNRILQLPYPDPADLIPEYRYSLNKASENFMLFNMVVINKFAKNEFESTVGSLGETNEGVKFNYSNFIEYIDNAFNQWNNFFVQSNLDSSEFEIRKNELKEELKDILDPFIRMGPFMKKYKIAEEFYIRHKTDPEVASIFKQELDDLYENNKDLLSIPMVHKMVAVKEDQIVDIIFEKYQKVIQDMKDYLRYHNPASIATYGDEFILSKRENNDNDVIDFLKSKSFDDKIEMQIKFTKNQVIEEMLHFKDKSIVVKARNEDYRLVNVAEIDFVHRLLVESGIDYTLRKKPQMKQFFLNVYEEECPNVDFIFAPINTFLENEQILKNANFDYNSMKNKDSEAIDDKMNAVIRDYKIKKYAYSVLSNKYKHLYSDDCFKYFKELHDSGITESHLQSYVGKKLASFETQEDFKAYINKLANQFSGFNIDALQPSLDKYGLKPIISEDNLYVFEIDTFEQSKEIGSPSWCIARSQHYFDSYKTDTTHQYFIFDYSKAKEDNDSMIGITLYKNGDFKTQHLKNDDFMSVNDHLKNIRKKLITAQIDQYDLSEQNIKEIGISEEIIEKKNKLLKNGNKI